MQHEILSKQKEKYIKSLSLTKFKQKYGKFISEGHKLATEIIQQKPLEIEYILATEEWTLANTSLLSQLADKIQIIDRIQLKDLSSQTTPQEPIVVANQFTLTELKHLDNSGWYIFLDRLQDPGNMGTILRVAEWFGVKAVIRSKGSVDFYNFKVVQAAMGSIVRMPIVQAELADVQEHLSSLSTVVTSLQGDNMYDVDIPAKGGIIIVGNESQGVHPDIESSADLRIKIPASPTNMAESLNAAMATGIVCSYLCR